MVVISGLGTFGVGAGTSRKEGQELEWKVEINAPILLVATGFLPYLESAVSVVGTDRDDITRPSRCIPLGTVP